MIAAAACVLLAYLVFAFVSTDLHPFRPPRTLFPRRRWHLGRAAASVTLLLALPIVLGFTLAGMAGALATLLVTLPAAGWLMNRARLRYRESDVWGHESVVPEPRIDRVPIGVKRVLVGDPSTDEPGDSSSETSDEPTPSPRVRRGHARSVWDQSGAL